MRHNQFDLSVLVHGKPIREYEAPDGRTFVEGRKGSEFTLRLRNFTPNRVLAVITVDGLSVIDGEKGDYKDSGGYVVNAHGYIDIPGWRLDNSEVAKFVFESIDGSYSAESGHGKKNVGVIGAAVFLERQWYYTVNNVGSWTSNASSVTYTTSGVCDGDYTLGVDHASNTSNCVFTCHSDIAAPSASRQVCEKAPKVDTQQIGTGFGKAASHKVVDVNFTKASDVPNAIFSIFYDSYDRLAAANIIRHNQVQVCRVPSPFPKNESGCKPPKSWCGCNGRRSK
jgi:hypothetical protein